MQIETEPPNALTTSQRIIRVGCLRHNPSGRRCGRSHIRSMFTPSSHHCTYQTVPGRSGWPSRDPITELSFLLQQTGRQLFQGSKSDAPPVGVEDDDFDINQLLVGLGRLNAYGFNGNNSIIVVDYLGLAPFCVCVQADDDHAWISVTDLATGERHAYGRWKIGYPRNAPAKARSSGVNTDMELKRGFGASRCVTLQSFTPTINAGYDAYNNNCATYAWSEWKRASGENLDKSGISSGTFDHPSVLKDSILKKNSGKKEVGCCK